MSHRDQGDFIPLSVEKVNNPIVSNAKLVFQPAVGPLVVVFRASTLRPQSGFAPYDLVS